MLTTLEQLKVSLQAVKRYINKVLPTKVSELQNDVGYLTEHQDISGKANISDLATIATSGDYDDLSNKPTIATPNWDATSTQDGYIENRTHYRQRQNVTILSSTEVTTSSYSAYLGIVSIIPEVGDTVEVHIKKDNGTWGTNILEVRAVGDTSVDFGVTYYFTITINKATGSTSLRVQSNGTYTVWIVLKNSYVYYKLDSRYIDADDEFKTNSLKPITNHATTTAIKTIDQIFAANPNYVAEQPQTMTDLNNYDAIKVSDNSNNIYLFRTSNAPHTFKSIDGKYTLSYRAYPGYWIYNGTTLNNSQLITDFLQNTIVSCYRSKAAKQNIIASEYDGTTTYAVGDIVLYNGGLYECNTAIGVAEAWTAAHWTAVTVDQIYVKNNNLATVATSGSYNDLSNKPTIPTVPTNVSAFTNDAGYLTSVPVSSVNNKTGAVSLSAADVGALPDNTIIPDDVWEAGTGTNSVKMKAATEASGNNSIAEGGTTRATKANAHAEGGGTTASGAQSHAEGVGTTASGGNSHAEGSGTTASGMNSHAEGAGNTASGVQSHAEGGSTVASGVQSHAEGASTIASGVNQHVQGKYNIEDNNNTYAHIVGNGNYQTRSNAHTLDWNGNGWYAGKLTVGAAPTNNMDVATKQYVDNATPTVPVQDVQINNSSILNNGVANIPIASSSTPGVVKPNQSLGIGVLNDGTIGIAPASAQNVKEGQSLNMAITPGRQKNSVFYGLASAAGDTTQKNSDNAVGTYTENAKTAIKSMLGVTDTPPEIFIGSTIPSGYTVYIDPDGSTVVGEGVSF